MISNTRWIPESYAKRAFFCGFGLGLIAGLALAALEDCT